MAAIPYRVVHAFERKEAARSGAFVSTGDALMTYAVELAYRDGTGAVHLTPAMRMKWSATTNRHQIAVREVLGYAVQDEED